MILILSTSKFESTTDEVIRWLNYYKADWKRLNGYDLQNGHSFFDRTTMQINSKELSTELCPVIWYRRWYEQDAFAESIQKLMNLSGSKRIIFLVGGAFGFHSSVYDRADGKIALSEMTFSHQLIRLIFMEQLYRAFAIINNHPYHNE